MENSESYASEILIESQQTDLFENFTNNTTSPWRGRDENLANIEKAVLAVIFLITIIGNTIVLLGIYLRSEKMTRMYYFLVHLSIADLTTAFFNVLTQLIWELTVTFQGGNILCKVVKYLQILGPFASSYVLVMTALDRYQVICHPLRNHTWTASKSKLMLRIAWTLSFLFCIPQLFVFSYIEPFPQIVPDVYDCWATFIGSYSAKAYVTYYCITVFIIPLIILVFSYTCICRTLCIHFTQGKNISESDQTDERQSRQVKDNSDNIQSHNNENGSKKYIWQKSSRHYLPGKSDKTSSVKSVINVNRQSQKIRVTTRQISSFSLKTQRTLIKNHGQEEEEERMYVSSVRRISRAKIKSVQFTVTIIFCYICCSLPFITSQLWLVYDHAAENSVFYTGPTFTILTLLASLTSCTNCWIFLIFNPNIFHNFVKGLFCTRRI